MVVVATHNGAFHADDVFSYSILRMAYDEKVTLIRSRDTEELSKAEIVFDVGRGKYDHHMSDEQGKPYRDDEHNLPYSSAGLIWKDYGKQAITESIIVPIDPSIVDRIWKMIDDSIILTIDLGDNGKTNDNYPDTNIASLISSFVATWEENESENNYNFEKASDIIKLFLTNKIKHIYSLIKAENIILDAFNKTPDKRYIVVDKYYPHRATCINYNLPILYFVYFSGNQWRIDCIPTDDNMFTQKKKLPAEWSGKADCDLQNVSGVDDATFCHPACFTCGAKSYEGIMKMLEKALNY